MALSFLKTFSSGHDFFNETIATSPPFTGFVTTATGIKVHASTLGRIQTYDQPDTRQQPCR